MKNLILAIALFVCACDSGSYVTNTDIVDALQAGEIVNINDGEASINGIVVGELSDPLVTGCFGIPTCVKMEPSDTSRGIIKISTDDFSYYAEVGSQEPPTGYTYFVSTYYSPYWATTGAYTEIRGLVDAAGYGDERVAYCSTSPERCVE